MQTVTAARPWPAEREARGILRVRHTVRTRVEMSGLEVLCSIQHGMLKIRARTDTRGEEGFANEVVRMPMESVVISVLPGCVSMFALSSKDGNGTDEVYCYARDQTARNKWIAIFRRQGVALYMRRRNGYLSRVLEPISETHGHRERPFSDGMSAYSSGPHAAHVAFPSPAFVDPAPHCRHTDPLGSSVFWLVSGRAHAPRRIRCAGRHRLHVQGALLCDPVDCFEIIKPCARQS